MKFTVSDARNAFDFLSAHVVRDDDPDAAEAAITYTRLALFFAQLGEDVEEGVDPRIEQVRRIGKARLN